jgi:heterodisulfide reductase subunit D
MSEEMAEVIYQCTLCNSCNAICRKTSLPLPFEIEYSLNQAKVFEALRADLVENGFILNEHRLLMESIKNYDNPWGQPRRARTRWANKNLEIKDAAKDKVDVLYYVGCTTSFDPTLRNNALTTVALLDRAGVNFGFLGNEEVCCGSIALRIGDQRTFERLARYNIEVFNELGVKTIVTSCAGCYKTLSQDYPQVGEINAEVLHSVQYMQRLLDEGKLKFTEKVAKKVTYHDPCHLGRHSKVYDAPREILAVIPGLTFKEMKRNREGALCCGAGGGVRAGFPSLTSEIAKERIEEAEETGAGYVVTTCPFCKQGLSDGIKAVGSKIEALDLVEIMEEAST